MKYDKVKLDELVKVEGESQNPSREILDKIIHYHLIPANLIREEINAPLYVRSCYRSIGWELAKGRSGNSQHTFQGNGAIDLSVTKATPRRVTNDHCADMLYILSRLETLGYKRIAYYPEKFFFHADYHSDATQFFLSDSSSNWSLSDKEEIYELISNGIE